MKFQFIHAHRDEFYVTEMCEVLEVSTSGFYKWLNRDDSREAFNRRLLKRIYDIYEENDRVHGRPYIYRQLRREGWTVNEKRVGRLMREEELYAQPKNVKRVTTDSDHSKPVAPNLLGRNFDPEAPNSVWGSDITYIRTHEGWLYLTTVMDLHSRKIVGWNIGTRVTADLTLGAFKKAVKRRNPSPGLIFHSDQGVQYAAGRFRAALERWDMRQSMARKGNCWDNAPAESWFATLKRECVPRRGYETRKQAKLDIFKFIEGYYNNNRLHSSLDYRTPTEYEQRLKLTG